MYSTVMQVNSQISIAGDESIFFSFDHRNELAHQKYNDFYNLIYRIKITKMIRTRVIIRNKE